MLEIDWLKYGTLSLYSWLSFFYSETYFKVRTGINGSLMNSIPTHNDVKIGLYSSPMLFNFCQ